MDKPKGPGFKILPAIFMFGLSQQLGELVIVGVAALLFAVFAWSLRNLVIGRKTLRVGSDTEAARLCRL
jgi:ribose/xylose/arabinose/galactoside ABC-type transport system permease subunit